MSQQPECEQYTCDRCEKLTCDELTEIDGVATCETCREAMNESCDLCDRCGTELNGEGNETDEGAMWCIDCVYKDAEEKGPVVQRVFTEAELIEIGRAAIYLG